MSAIKIEKGNTNLKSTKREVKYFASVFLSLVQIYNNLKQSNDVIELDMVLQTTKNESWLNGQHRSIKLFCFGQKDLWKCRSCQIVE